MNDADSEDAEAFVASMKRIWNNVRGSLIGGPRAEIVNRGTQGVLTSFEVP